MVERLIAHLAHVEVITPKPEKSVGFFRDVLGLEESGRAGKSVYFRGWGEFFHHSLQLTEGPAPAVAHTGWRTEGPEELQACVKRLEARGVGIGWQELTVGHGAAYRFRSPGGHVHEVFWESDRYIPPPMLAPTVPNRPQRYITRGAGARRIDHVTFNTDDPLRDAKWFQEVLGFRLMEYAKLDHADVVVTAFVSSTPMSHDLGLVLDAIDRTGKLSGVKGRATMWPFGSIPAKMSCAPRTSIATQDWKSSTDQASMVSGRIYFSMFASLADCVSSCSQAATCCTRRIFSRSNGRCHKGL
jgi:catechol 2,3-dioxygenase